MNSKFFLNAYKFNDLKGFYEEIYSLMNLYEDWKPSHNLDALNDMLYSGFGENAVLVWLNSEKSRKDLGKEATIEFYRNKINQGKPFNVEWAKSKLTEIEIGKGQTLFEIILEIFAEHPRVKLILE